MIKIWLAMHYLLIEEENAGTAIEKDI